jgi:hypothetical protein
VHLSADGILDGGVVRVERGDIVRLPLAEEFEVPVTV